MASSISIAQLVLLGLVVVLLLWLAPRRGDADATDRLERNLRADVQDSARGTRSELSQSLALAEDRPRTPSRVKPVVR